MADKDSDQRFQVDLGGVIAVLSDNLYSSPRVAFRELLQNSLDAITARRSLQPGHAGHIQVELVESGDQRTVVVEDDGIGLTEDEIHLFLATIGGSSKRASDDSREQFLGQFGIGLLSCFVLTEELVVITRSAARPEAPAWEWRGKSDGTYIIRRLTTNPPPGTRTYLTIKKAFAGLCAAEALQETLAHYGEFLPVSIELQAAGRPFPVSAPEVPWPGGDRPGMDQAALWKAAERYFGGQFHDVIPIHAPAGGVDGFAFVSGEPRGPQARPAHRVYLKGMLLSERTEGIAPDWAVFVNVLVNATRLRPTASRERLVEDEILEQTRQQIGGCILAYLRRLAASDPERLARLIRTHDLALKSLALQDEDVLRSIAPWFEFETTAGRKRFEELRALRHVQYAPSVDRFRQLAPIATAEGRCLVNAGYVHEADLMAALAAEFPELELEAVDALSFGEWLGEVGDREAERLGPLLEAAREALRDHRCDVDLRTFRPDSLPVLYARNDAAESFRAFQRSSEAADGFFASLLGDLDGRFAAEARHVLHLNAANPLIRRMADVGDAGRLLVMVEVLYIQALLLGQYPITERETRRLSLGLTRLIEMGL